MKWLTLLFSREARLINQFHNHKKNNEEVGIYIIEDIKGVLHFNLYVVLEPPKEKGGVWILDKGTCLTKHIHSMDELRFQYKYPPM